MFAKGVRVGVSRVFEALDKNNAAAEFIEG
jgi:hypothetical protein